LFLALAPGTVFTKKPEIILPRKQAVVKGR
jgi:hypothetical protein